MSLLCMKTWLTSISLDFRFLHFLLRLLRWHHHAVRHGVVGHHGHLHHGLGHHGHHGSGHHGALVTQHNGHDYHGAHGLLCTTNWDHQHAHIAHPIIVSKSTYLQNDIRQSCDKRSYRMNIRMNIHISFFATFIEMYNNI